METIEDRMVRLETLGEQFHALISEKKLKEAQGLLLDLNEVDIADLIDSLDPMTGVVLYRMLPKDTASEVFANFDAEQQEAIIRVSTDAELKHIVDELYFDDMIDMLEEMPATVVKRILQQTSSDERKLINEYLRYPEDSAGSLMTIEYVSLKKDWTVRQALDKIKREGIDKETIYTLYVVDRNRVLEGILSLRELVVSAEDVLIADLMQEDVIYVHTDDDREDVAADFRKYGFSAIPVVDRENRIVGIITYDDIMDVMEEETSEDFQIMAAVTPSEKPYLEQSVFELAKHRILWLLVLMVSATITQRIIGRYEAVLVSVGVLNAFIPMLMDTGGNSGSQSSTLIIRGLATGEVRARDTLAVLWKEFRVAILVGVVLALVNYGRLILFEKMPQAVAMTVSLTIIGSVVMAKITGALLPIAAEKLKLDPAIMASPLITTIADAASLIIYFQIATAIMGL